MRLLLLGLALFAVRASAQPVVLSDAPARGTEARHALALDLPALSAAAEARTPVAMDLFGQRLVATPDRVERRGADRFTVSSALAGGGRVLLTSERGVVFGRVFAPGLSLVIETRNGATVAYRPAEDPDDEDDAVVPPARTGEARTGGADVLFPDELHVAMFYVPSVADSLGDGIQAYMQGTVDVLTEILANSNVRARARLVAVEPVQYVEAGSMSDDLYAFVDPEDGLMDEVAAVRDAVSADLMMLITEVGSNSATGCGIAFLMTDPTDASFGESAYGVTKRSCQFGFVFSHEVGHNIGLHHDRYVTNGQGAFPYSYGIANTDSLDIVAGRNGFRTMLAYNRACEDLGGSCDRIPFYSNPDSLWNGQSMGDFDTDNALSARQTVGLVAGFRAPVLKQSFAGTTAGRASAPRPVCADPGDIASCTVSADAVPFTVNSIQATTAGLYYVRTATDADGVLLLYDGAYDATTPLQNLVGYAEPDAEAPATRRLLLSARLGAGRTYTLVTTGRTPADAGAFSADVFGPGAGQVAVPAEDAAASTEALQLGPATPNPSQGASTIALRVAQTGPVEVALFDVLGRRVAVLHQGVLTGGAVHTVEVGDVPPGVYVVRAQSASATVTQRVTRL